MTGFNDTSDQLFNDPDFQAKLDQACKSAFKRYSNPPYEKWEGLRNDVFILLRESRTFFLQYQQLTNEDGYLYRIALNRLISKHRHQRGAGNVISSDDLKAFASDLTVEKQDLKIFMRELFKEVIPFLKPHEQAVIEGYLEDKSFADMAREGKVTRATISKRFANAIKHIKKHLMQRRVRT